MKKIIAIISVLLLFFSLASCSLSREKEYDAADYRTTMQFYDDFKVLQLTDIHLGVESDMKLQLDSVRDKIRKENPDLIVVTGDSFMYASRKIVKQLIKTLNEECQRVSEARGERICKFAFTFGNHDNQGSYPRYFINKTILKYTAKDGNEIKENKYAAFVDYKNDNLFGLTNYYIDLVDDRAKPRDSVDVIYRIHIIDSNSYYFNGKDYDYDVIHSEQLAHAKNIYSSATADKDYIGIAFFHIPLVEFEEAKTQYLASQTPELIGQGEWREPKVLSGYTNNGAYTALREANISAFFVGHDHENYGEIIYNAESTDVNDKAIFSYGVKCTNQLYHDTDMIGYKTVTLKSGVSEEDFVSIEYINENIKNITTENTHYEK